MKNIWPRPIDKDQYEFVFLEGYPLAVESNSDDPPNSYYSKDVFTPHPTIPDAWKYLGRLDDRVTLINGEKVLPLPIEGRIKKHPLVREDVIFGDARQLPGSLIFRAEAAKDMADEEFIDTIWPDVQAANTAAEGFSQIGKDMIVPLPAGIEYPQADKGSFIRPQMYRAFEKEIDDAYSRLERTLEGTMQLEIPDLEEHLLNVGRQLLGQRLETKTTDFFAAGMDSLGAIQMRGSIVKDLDLGGNSKNLSQNVVFETSNVENLAKLLYGLRQGQKSNIQDPKIAIQGLLQKYSMFQKHTPGSKPHVVLLTGATGGLGSQLVSKISLEPSVSRIYCLLRGPEPLLRLQSSLKDRKLDLQASKITALTSDLSHPSLSLDEATFFEIQSSVTHIIHAAWPVNFQIPLCSFETHIQGLHNLLQLSLSSPHAIPARFLFCSSVSTALGAPAPTRVPESIIEDMDYALDMGYGQSKFVGEHIVAAAVEEAGAQASILRIGQVVGDTKSGMWNDREAFPSIVRSALTMGILPELPVKCEWLPVDTLAESVIELAGLDDSTVTKRRQNMNDSEGANTSTRGAQIEQNRKIDVTHDGRVTTINNDTHAEVDGTTKSDVDNTTMNHQGVTGTTTDGEKKPPNQASKQMNLVYNLISPHTFSWTHDFLPALHNVGLSFSPVSTETWLQRLRSLSSSSSTNKKDETMDPAADPEKNPALKLLQYYESSFGKRDEEKDGRAEFDIEGAMRDCRALRESEDMLESGLVGKMVEWWMGRWEGGGGEGDEDGDSGSGSGKVREGNGEEEIQVDGDGDEREKGVAEEGEHGDEEREKKECGSLEDVTSKEGLQATSAVGEKEAIENYNDAGKDQTRVNS
ncbi:MAG: hypothetical protein Q9166_001704 [cf. Caloplaca sp. 2 TL-2023]